MRTDDFLQDFIALAFLWLLCVVAVIHIGFTFDRNAIKSSCRESKGEIMVEHRLLYDRYTCRINGYEYDDPWRYPSD